MESWVVAIITAIISVAASSGFWQYLIHKDAKKKEEEDKSDAKTRLLIGLAHDRILFLCSSYTHRGYITKEEYDDLNKYLYEPYEEAGGNGSAKKMMMEVEKLPVYKPIYLPKEEHQEFFQEKGV